MGWLQQLTCISHSSAGWASPRSRWLQGLLHGENAILACGWLPSCCMLVWSSLGMCVWRLWTPASLLIRTQILWHQGPNLLIPPNLNYIHTGPRSTYSHSRAWSYIMWILGGHNSVYSSATKPFWMKGNWKQLSLVSGFCLESCSAKGSSLGLNLWPA